MAICLPQVTSKNIYGFDPRNVPGCQLWLDAADASTLTFSSGSNVSSWRDKSINVSSTTSVAGTNVLTQNAMNGRQAILLNGSSSFTGSTTGSGNTLTVCIVATQSNTCATNGGLVCFGRPGFDDWNDIGSLAITNFVGIGSGQMGSTRTANSQTVNTGVSTPFIYILVFDGTFVNSYLNGIIQTPTNISLTGTFAYTGYKIGTRAGATVNVFWTGFIGEVLVYNTGLITSQRQQVEGYLAHKWGIGLTLHPFNSIRPFLREFNPIDISGCQLWLDAADSSTITGTSSVTAWRDKTASLTLTGSGSTYTTVSGYPAITFNGNQFVSSTNIPYERVCTSDANFTTFIVQLTTSSSGVNGLPFTIFLTGNVRRFAVFSNGGGSGGIFIDGASQGSPRLGGITQTLNTPQLLTITRKNITTMTARLNGSQVSSSNFPGTTNFISSNSYFVFISNGSGPWSGNMYEIIHYNRDMLDSEIQQVEGYLAYKWGLISPLPATHSYKKLPPSSALPFLPIGISGCELWFDGGDNTTMFQNTAGTTPVTAGSQSVACWKDKIRNLSITNTGVPGQSMLAPTSVSGGGVFFNNTSTVVSASAQGLGTSLTGATNQTAFLFRMPTRSMTMITASYPLSNNNYRQICCIASDPIGAGNVPNFSMGHEIGAQNGGTILFDWNGSSWGQIAQSTSGYNSNTVLRIDSLVADSNPIWLTNGTSNTFSQTNTYTTANSNYPVNRFAMGGYSSIFVGSRNFHGTIYETILYSKVLTTAERQQVEGYLAHKWGLKSSLPSTHLYRSFPPSFQSPTLIAATPSGDYSNFLWTRFYNITSDPSISGPGSSGWGSLIGTAGAYNPINYQDGDSRIGQNDYVGVISKGFMYSATQTVVTFRTLSDDGIAVIFNGSTVLQNWTYHGDTTDTSASVTLSAGYTPIELRFFEWGGGFTCELYWSVGSTGTYASSGSGVMFHNDTSKT